jgi:hypothetical protein
LFECFEPRFNVQPTHVGFAGLLTLSNPSHECDDEQRPQGSRNPSACANALRKRTATLPVEVP